FSDGFRIDQMRLIAGGSRHERGHLIPPVQGIRVQEPFPRRALCHKRRLGLRWSQVPWPASEGRELRLGLREYRQEYARPSHTRSWRCPRRDQRTSRRYGFYSRVLLWVRV